MRVTFTLATNATDLYVIAPYAYDHLPRGCSELISLKTHTGAEHDWSKSVSKSMRVGELDTGDLAMVTE